MLFTVYECQKIANTCVVISQDLIKCISTGKKTLMFFFTVNIVNRLVFYIKLVYITIRIGQTDTT